MNKCIDFEVNYEYRWNIYSLNLWGDGYKKLITVCLMILFFILSIFIYVPVSAVNTGFESHNNIAKDRIDYVLQRNRINKG